MQGRRNREVGGGVVWAPPPLNFFRKNEDLFREEALQPPHFKSLYLVPPSPLEKLFRRPWCETQPIKNLLSEVIPLHLVLVF